MSELLVVFVHGWGSTNTKSYGGLPERLRREARAAGLTLRTQHILLGRYVSFRNEVRIADVSRAFEAAVDDAVRPLLAPDRRFACVTHSTGGPVIRDWWHRFYVTRRGGPCPLSHLVMLAPANFGSALAQLGKGRIGRLKSWLGGVEPGTGILDWLELGSAESWALNEAWIGYGERRIAAQGVFPFVLTGQSIDRKLYDHLNSYTGETGSDGVVRVAAANLNCGLVRLTQQEPLLSPGGRLSADALRGGRPRRAPRTAFRIVGGASHAGTRSGIMRSVRPAKGEARGEEVVQAILDCLAVRTRSQYKALTESFADDTARIQDEERVEVERNLLPSTSYFVHDRYSMVIFRLQDDHGQPIEDYDLLLTAGADSDPNALPRGFFVDRQRNSRQRSVLTYFLNYDVMVGSPAVVVDGKTVREASPGASALGFRIQPRPQRGFAHYLPCEILASSALLKRVLQPNGSTLIDIRLRRIVKKNVFRLSPPAGRRGTNFKNTKPGTEIVE